MERIEEKNVDKEHRIKLFSKKNLEFELGKSVGGLKNTKNEFVSNVVSTSMDSEETVGIIVDERLDRNAVEEHRVEPCSVDDLDSAPLKSYGGNKDSMNDGISITNPDSMDGYCRISMGSEGLDNVKTRLTSTQDLSIKASINVMAMEKNGIKQKMEVDNLQQFSKLLLHTLQILRERFNNLDKTIQDKKDLKLARMVLDCR